MKDMIEKGSQTNAHLIRYHRDNEIEKDHEKGIVRGRAQLSEADLMALFEAHRYVTPLPLLLTWQCVEIKKTNGSRQPCPRSSMSQSMKS